MHKKRKSLLIALIVIFVLTGTAFLTTVFGDDSGNTITGAAVSATQPMNWAVVVPGILFIGFIILTIFYLEKKY